jgi:hypothetical protein
VHASLGSLTPITSSSATSATEFSYKRSRSKVGEDKASDSTDVSTAMYAASLKDSKECRVQCYIKAEKEPGNLR